MNPKDYYNRIPVEFVVKPSYNLLEDKEYISRFSLKNIKEIGNIPINQPIKYSEEIMKKAIRYGMIFMINYRGAEDGHYAGHERVIYPMVLGRSQKGKILLRGWHLAGWSVSSKKHMNKIWRMFRADRILSMTFTGSFYRLAPAGYNMDDKGMRGGIIARADFKEIRRLQTSLVNQNKIQNRDDVDMNSQRSFANVLAKETDTTLDLRKPFDNAYVNNSKNDPNFRMTFLKSVYGNDYVVMLNAMGQPGNTVRIVTDTQKSLGVFKVLDSITGEKLKLIKNVKGNTLYKVYIFDKKL